MTEKPSNVLLITCDCLRADFVGCCRDDTGTSLTPNLDRLAEKAITFKKAFSQGFGTGVSMPSLFTGKYPSRLTPFKIRSPLALRQFLEGVLVGQDTTITEILAQHHYQTAGIHSNPFLTNLFGFDKGFEFFYDDLFLGKANLPASFKRWAYRVPRLLRASPHLTAAQVNKMALAWLKTTKGPFFLFLHYMDTHGPYLPKKGFRYLNKMRSELLYRKAKKTPKGITDKECRSLVSWYKEEITYLDRHLGMLFEELQKTGQMDNTLVVVTADHGDEFREHGRFNHHSTLYDELLHVPLIFKLPYSRMRGKVITEMAALLQVVPTILDVLNIQTDQSFDGKSLLPLIERNDKRSLHDFLISEAKFAPRYKACIRNEEWKLILDVTGQRRELYNLKKDPRELSNVIKESADIAAELEMRLREHQSVTIREKERTESLTEVDKDVLDRLKALGYL